MATTQSKYGRRFDEDFKREVAALASKPGAKQEQVARDLGVSSFSLGRWKKRYATMPPASSVHGVSVPELERRIRALERENADLREQRIILKKAVAIFSEAQRKDGDDQNPRGRTCGAQAPPGARRSTERYYTAQKKEEGPRAREDMRLGAKARELFEVSGQDDDGLFKNVVLEFEMGNFAAQPGQLGGGGGLRACGWLSFAAELPRLRVFANPSVEEARADAELLGHFGDGFTDGNQLDELGFKFGGVSLSGHGSHGRLFPYFRGPESSRTSDFRTRKIVGSK